LELEIVKEFKSMDLALIKKFDYNEILEIFVIGNHFDKIFYSLKLQLLFFEHFDNCQELFIINLIIIFGRDIFNWKENNKIKNFYRIILKEYTF